MPLEKAHAGQRGWTGPTYLAPDINTTVDQLSFAAGVTEAVSEVGSEGRLGAQAEAEGVSGTWKQATLRYG